MVGAVSLAACSSAANTTAQSAALPAAPGGTPATASSPAAPHSATASPSSTAPVTIAAVGDMSLGNTPDLPPSPTTYLDPVKSELTTGAQIVFANLEGTLTTVDGSKCGSAGLTQTVQSIHAAGLAQTGLPDEITLVSANGVKVASWPSPPPTGQPACSTCPWPRP